MIKNEEKIILRCINSALPVVDAILISDTGSTDKTIDVLTTFFSTLSIPTKIVHESWVNFGVNRTNSFVSAVKFSEELGWDAYAMVLDADMILKNNGFDRSQLTHDGYLVEQGAPNIIYNNIRLMKLSYPWKCQGATHEYWDGPNCPILQTLTIEDKGDGGCKQDKFVRDEKLLREGLQEDPTNIRYMFYYAQTLRDLGRHGEAIEWYKKRIQQGGWVEEVWYSMYQLCRIYSTLNNLADMEYWCMKSYEFYPKRSENIYVALKKYRQTNQHFKAWHYYKLGVNIPKPSNALFLENDVYTFLFPYEKTILNYYVYPNEDFLYEMVCYINTYNDHIWNNLHYYIHKIPCLHTRPLFYPDIDGYTPSSVSVLKMSSRYLLNIRYVNYRINPNGSYKYPPNMSCPYTRNYTTMTDSHFTSITPLEEMVCEPIDKYGIEDIRLYTENNTIRWMGASPDYPSINMITGVYNLFTKRLEHRVHLKSPLNASCEKNWIPIQNKCIYKWYPYTVGVIQQDEYKTEITQQTPRFFKHMSGSSPAIDYNGSLYTMTHIIVGRDPRKYYHCLVKINPLTYLIEAYTLPFYFIQPKIEYCLGIDLCEDVLSVFISQNDASPALVEIDMNTIEFISI